MKNIPGRDKFIKENVVRVGNTFKVRITADLKESEVNAFIRKMKETKGNEVMDNWSPAEVAEAMASYVIGKFLNADSIPVSAITGDEDTPDNELTAAATTPPTDQGAQVIDVQAQAPTDNGQTSQEIIEPAAEPLNPLGPVENASTDDDKKKALLEKRRNALRNSLKKTDVKE